MPIFFIGTGVVFIFTGLRGSPSALYGLIKGDLEGPNNYIYWAVSILLLGSLGYIKSLQSLSRLFVSLVLIVLLLDNKGFFAKLQEFIDSQKTPAATTGAGGSY